MGALMLLASCSKQSVLDTAPTSAKQVESRCCTEDGQDILGNPLFDDWLNYLQTGIIEPTEQLLNALDTNYLLSLIDELVLCIETEQDLVACADAFREMLYVKNYVEGRNQFLLDSLRGQYPTWTDEQFEEAFLEAIGEAISPPQRGLPCFSTYQNDVQALTEKLALTTASPNRMAQVLGVLAYASGLLRAHNNYCACIYNTYNRPC